MNERGEADEGKAGRSKGMDEWETYVSDRWTGKNGLRKGM